MNEAFLLLQWSKTPPVAVYIVQLIRHTNCYTVGFNQTDHLWLPEIRFRKPLNDFRDCPPRSCKKYYESLKAFHLTLSYPLLRYLILALLIKQGLTLAKIWYRTLKPVVINVPFSFWCTVLSMTGNGCASSVRCLVVPWNQRSKMSLSILDREYLRFDENSPAEKLGLASRCQDETIKNSEISEIRVQYELIVIFGRPPPLKQIRN